MLSAPACASSVPDKPTQASCNDDTTFVLQDTTGGVRSWRIQGDHAVVGTCRHDGGVAKPLPEPLDLWGWQPRGKSGQRDGDFHVAPLVEHRRGDQAGISWFLVALLVLFAEEIGSQAESAQCLFDPARCVLMLGVSHTAAETSARRSLETDDGSLARMSSSICSK